MKGKIFLELWTVFLTRFSRPWDRSFAIISLIAESLTVHRIVALNIGSYIFWVTGRRERFYSKDRGVFLKPQDLQHLAQWKAHKPSGCSPPDSIQSWRAASRSAHAFTSAFPAPLFLTSHFSDHPRSKSRKAYEKFNNKAEFSDTTRWLFRQLKP